MKTCYKCTEEKTLDHFAKDSVKKDGKCIYCNDCKKDINSKRNYKVYNSNSVWHENNPSFRKEYNDKYRKENYSYFLAKNAERRATQLNASPAWADKKKIQGVYFEAQKLTTETGIVYHVDHIIPLINKLVCGLHVEHNLQVIPAKDNLSKHNSFEPIYDVPRCGAFLPD